MNQSLQHNLEPITLKDLIEKILSFQETRIILSAVELGVFDSLINFEKSAKELAEELNADARGIERLCNALVGMRLLEKQAGKFQNTTVALEYLVSLSPDYIGALEHWSYIWADWSNLTERIKKGRENSNQISEFDERKSRAFISAMNWKTQINALEVIAEIDFSKVFKMIDIGGGSGAYSIEFLKSKPGLRATVFDLPNIIPISKEYVELEGYSDKFNFIEGDMNKDDLGKGYDLALLSSVVHINSPEENFNLMYKVYDSLNRGGFIVVQDFIVDSERCFPPLSSQFGVNMYVRTDKGDVYTATEIKMFMKEALFSDVKMVNLPSGTALFIGRK